MLVVLAVGAVSHAQQMTVKIIDQRTSETSYTYQVPGRATSTTNVGSNSITTNSVYTAPENVSFTVTGATLALLLPDGRIAVVNCVSKFAFRAGAPAGLPGLAEDRRSCRMPIVDKIQVKFKGKGAKLEWSASVDGKKKDSETYKILGIFPPIPANTVPAQAQASARSPQI